MRIRYGVLSASVVSLSVFGAATADPLLEIHTQSLTTYVPSTVSSVQGVRPLAMQRGVGVDGASRAGSTFRLSMQANPFERSFASSASVSGINAATGVAAIGDVDLAFPATVPWVIGRTYNPRQKDSGGSYITSAGYQGNNWFQSSQPEIVFHDSGTDSEDMIYLVYGADRYIEFRRADDVGSGDSADTFRATNGAAGAIVIETNASAPDLATYTDQTGQQMVFLWIGDADIDDDVEGQVWKRIDPAGNVAYVGDGSSAATAITNGFDTATGAIVEAFDSDGRRFSYTYDGTTGLLTEVDVETGGGPWTSVGSVTYSYYVNADDDGGDGDLRTVAISMPLSDGTSTRTKYYRYYEGAYDGSGTPRVNPGYPSLLKYVYGFEGIRRFDWSGDSTFDDDFLTATASALEPYADSYYEYDTDRRVITTWNGGQCGCGGGVSGAHEFTYESNGSFSGTSGYDQTWFERTIVELPSFVSKPSTTVDSWETHVFDELGQPITRIRTPEDPSTLSASPHEAWVTSATRDASGAVSAVYSPASVTSYTHSTGAIATSTSAGLVTWINRVASGDRKGLPYVFRSSEGSAGSKYYDGLLAYTQTSYMAGDMTIVRPLVSSTNRYTEAVTFGTSGVETTSMAYAYHSGGTAALAIKSVTTTHPIVSTSKNGSGTADTTARYLRADGTTAFSKAEDGIYGYTAFDEGQLIEQATDVDLSATFPTGDDPNSDFGITENSNGWDRVSTFTYDAQGRRLTATRPDGRVAASHYERLADERLISLSYPKYVSGTSTLYGPASFQVSNLAGKPEASGTIAISGGTTTNAASTHVDQTESDPLEAIAEGTVASYQTTIYDDGGVLLEEQRLYFDIPASGVGVDGTNYDPTFFAYNDQGHRVRTLAPHGTISRVVHDTRGRPVEQWIGTNDNGWEGGSASGTATMERTSVTVYDDSDPGNSFVTERTLHVNADESDPRTTEYTYDVKGRVLITEAPTAPHAVAKYDHLGRQVAVAMYSSAPVSWSDPTSTASNRLALSQSFYDERGRVWKSQRHKIDMADGSDDDNLQSLTWYDAAGRTIKVDGEQLAKSGYDRVGRQTHSFVLAVDDDTVYADADDVSGDAVLEESQTAYESTTSDEVLVRASISRFHDDYDTGLTTGALDTNADADALTYTASNIEGRIQISAMWYDELGRMTGSVAYGTNGGATFNHTSPSASPPTRSDTELVTEFEYDDAGRQYAMIDPKGLEQQVVFDDAGRQVATIANYKDGTPSGDTDHYVRTVYADGLRTKYWVDFDGDDTEDSDDQVTTYIYGTAAGAGSTDSEIATGHMLYQVAYPDSTGASDRVTYAYNAHGQRIYTKDQAGTILELDYDDAGRATATRATTIASGLDTRVERIARAYDSLGRVDTVSQFDDPSAGSVLDQVGYTYDGWGNVTKFEQDHDSAIGGTLLYDVEYTYEKATTGRNTIRRTGMDLPNGDDVAYVYLGGIKEYDSESSRVTRITLDNGSGAVAVAKYDYLGAGHVVGMEYPEADILRAFHGSSSGSYPDFDRFNRLVNDVWEKDLATDVAFYDMTIEYDRNSSITRLEDGFHLGFDAIVAVDDRNRITGYEQGTLSGGSITSTTRDEAWVLDQVGNWSEYDLDEDGDATLELDETRTTSKANEVTGRNTDSTGADEYSPVYSAAGAMEDDDEDYKYVYDAFGQLIEIRVTTGANDLVVEYTYNGLGYRISRHSDVDDDGDVDMSDPKYQHVYDTRWRIVGTYRSSDADPKEQWVRSAAGAGGYGVSSYIESLVLRDKDTNTDWDAESDGALEERVYFAQSWRNDVVAVVDVAGEQVEHARYSPYGVPFAIPAGDADSDGDVDSSDLTLIGLGAYVARYDVDLDGVVDSGDVAAAGGKTGAGGGLWLLSSSAGNCMGLGGMVVSDAVGPYIYLSNWRALHVATGRWLSRDPAGYVDGASVLEFVRSRPMVYVDPEGLSVQPVKIAGPDTYSEAVSKRRGPWFAKNYRHYMSVDVSASDTSFVATVSSSYDSRRQGVWYSDLAVSHTEDVTVVCTPRSRVNFIRNSGGTLHSTVWGANWFGIRAGLQLAQGFGGDDDESSFVAEGLPVPLADLADWTGWIEVLAYSDLFRYKGKFFADPAPVMPSPTLPPGWDPWLSPYRFRPHYPGHSPFGRGGTGQLPPDWASPLDLMHLVPHRYKWGCDFI